VAAARALFACCCRACGVLPACPTGPLLAIRSPSVSLVGKSDAGPRSNDARRQRFLDALQPPASIVFGNTASQCEIFDAYYEDIQRQVLPPPVLSRAGANSVPRYERPCVEGGASLSLARLAPCQLLLAACAPAPALPPPCLAASRPVTPQHWQQRIAKEKSAEAARASKNKKEEKTEEEEPDEDAGQAVCVTAPYVSRHRRCCLSDVPSLRPCLEPRAAAAAAAAARHSWTWHASRQPNRARAAREGRPGGSACRGLIELGRQS
jgi:hypothetical protein